ncbi:MAG: chemotaxis protein CheW [Victivallales bacterium]|nr:chemotaxis protein CheW [Victivallales bacterium]
MTEENTIRQLSGHSNDSGLEEEDSMRDRFLTFRVGGEDYGIEIMYVTEIVSMQKVTEVPDMPDYIRGVINLRGQVIPVMDVRTRFQLEPREYDDRTCAIVVNIASTVIGLIVDSVDEVMKIAAENISLPPAVSESRSGRFIGGMGQVGNRVTILLSIEQLLFDNWNEAAETPARC